MRMLTERHDSVQADPPSRNDDDDNDASTRQAHRRSVRQFIVHDTQQLRQVTERPAAVAFRLDDDDRETIAQGTQGGGGTSSMDTANDRNWWYVRVLTCCCSEDADPHARTHDHDNNDTDGVVLADYDNRYGQDANGIMGKFPVDCVEVIEPEM